MSGWWWCCCCTSVKRFSPRWARGSSPSPSPASSPVITSYSMDSPPPVEHVNPPARHRDQTLNAVSFGFIATAVLFAMFMIMAIFERVLRPHRAFRARARRDEEFQAQLHPGPGQSNSQKPELRRQNSYSRSVSVLMPGYEYPTYFAKLIPSPLAPEPVAWPSHAEPPQEDPTLQRSRSQKEAFFGRALSNLGEIGSSSWRSGRVPTTSEKGNSSGKGGSTSN